MKPSTCTSLFTAKHIYIFGKFQNILTIQYRDFFKEWLVIWLIKHFISYSSKFTFSILLLCFAIHWNLPVFIPIWSCIGVCSEGNCLFLDIWRTSMAIEAISDTCFSPFLFGKPATNIRASILCILRSLIANNNFQNI